VGHGGRGEGRERKYSLTFQYLTVTIHINNHINNSGASMPITQTRMLNTLAAWQQAVSIIQNLKQDAEDANMRIVREGKSYEEAFFDLLTKLRKTTIPFHELLTAEQVHFKKSQYRNNYMQRRAAKARGKEGLGERYAADSILPNANKLPKVQPAQLIPTGIDPKTQADLDRDAAFMKAHPEFEIEPPPITPPDPDTMVEALKDINPEDLL
jgi:hypothetical protein